MGSRRDQAVALIEMARLRADAKAEEMQLLRALADSLEQHVRLIDKATAQAMQQQAPPRAPSRFTPAKRRDSNTDTMPPLDREDLTRIRSELDRGSRVISQVLSRLEPENDVFDQDASKPTRLTLSSELDDD